METPRTMSSGKSYRKKQNGRYKSDSFYSSRNSTATPNSLQKVNSWMISLNGNGLDRDFLLRNQRKISEDDLSSCCSSMSGSSFPSGLQKRPKSAPTLSSALIRRLPKRKTKKMEILDVEDPLSPESEKKKELCSYLQLMKPTDKVTIVNLQNRRSNRVKNLNIMHGKKVLEKKLKEGSSDTDLFHFPVPVDQLRHKVCDFNSIAEEDWFVQCRKEKSFAKPKVVNGGRNGLKSFTFPDPPNILTQDIVDFGEVVQEHGFKGFANVAEENKLLPLIQRLYLATQNKINKNDGLVQKHNLFKESGFKIRIIPKKRKRQSSKNGASLLDSPSRQKTPKMASPFVTPKVPKAAKKSAILKLVDVEGKSLKLEQSRPVSPAMSILAIFKDQVCCESETPKSFHCEILNIERDEVSSGEMRNLFNGVSPCADLVETSPCRHKLKTNQHCIKISEDLGQIIKIFYIDYNLVICQESLVSFWTQTALGNILGAQNMWLNKGSVQRLCMNNNCTFKGATDMVVSAEGSLAYVELWTKEHQSVMRQGPVADVFATVYFTRKGMKCLEKKVLQLQNINGFAEDVQYSVLKSSPKIIVSWHLATTEVELQKTCVACYQLSSDFQSICKNQEFEAVEHYVSSLHNIEGSDTIILGSGENKITLWNVERGHVAATIEMCELRAPIATLWVKCDRGFLFTLQECSDSELRLIAINGMDHSWKKLASYVPPSEYERLKGVSLENGAVVGLYDGGIVVWNAQSSEIIMEHKHSPEFITGKCLIDIIEDQIVLRHPFAQLLR